MKLLHRILKTLSPIGSKLDPSSLQVRLTLGVATLSALGLGGVTLWISLQLQHTLVVTHKQNLKYLVDRFPHDVEIYSDMVSLEMGMQKTIARMTTDNTLLWVKNPQGQISAQSTPMEMGADEKAFLALQQIPPTLELQQVNGRYWLLCKNALVVKNVDLGHIYIAQDVTSDQIMFLSFIKSLSLATLIALSAMTVAIACYVKRSLYPLEQMSQITAKISPDQLGEAQIQLENAPSEVRQLAYTFEQTLMRLSEAWEHQRQLVSNVSHELRTPLTIVSGYLQSTLRRGSNLTPPQREALEIAASETDRTIQLLQDLLDLARADSGRMHFHLEPLLLNNLLDEVVSLANKYGDRLIDREIPAQPLTIKADPSRLQQILLNLIDNAVKYSDADSPINVKLDQHQGQARIQVCDRGIGIPLSHQTRIFERFYRVDEARSRTTGGTGLGLSIVKTLIEGMGGNISVQSQPDKGSIFIVTFPLVDLLHK